MCVCLCTSDVCMFIYLYREKVRAPCFCLGMTIFIMNYQEELLCPSTLFCRRDAFGALDSELVILSSTSTCDSLAFPHTQQQL